MKNLNSIILAIGIALAGYFVYCGIDNIAHKDRFVTVKGLSERDVLADKVTWSLNIGREGENFQECYRSIEPDKEELKAFLVQHGVKEDEIFFEVPTLEDRSDYYNWEERKKYTARYQVTQSVIIVSNDVQKIIDLRKQPLEFLNAGIVASMGYCSFEYTGLNQLKPEMVEEATRNARVVADKLAADAQCSLGSIRTARQGQFEVESDEVMPHLRHVRVVTTIDYYLK